jgi:feruloyl esterase
MDSRLIATFTVPAREIQTAFYGRKARYSYFDGCSTGGAQAFALAERYPEMFDGIHAGSPGNWYSHLVLMFLWNGLHTQVSMAGVMDVNRIVSDLYRARGS